jgi:cystathionine beta-lyase
MSNDDINEPALRLRSGEKWNHYPSDVLPAWVADMDYVVAEPIRRALTTRIEHADLGYPMAHGRNGLLELFCQRVAERFAWSIDVNDVVIINDVVQGLYLGLLTLTEPRAGVVIQTPIYPPFLHAAEETGRRVVRAPLTSGTQHYEIDFDQLESALDKSTRMLMLCNPHNPCGRAFTRAELERLAELCCRHDLLIVSDEIHADLILGDIPHIPIAALDKEVAARTVTLMSASKAFNIAGLCMAFAHIGSPALMQRWQSIPAHARGGTNTMSIAAVHAAWSAAQPWQDEVLQTLRRNRDLVSNFITTHWPQVGHFPPQATYLAWLDMRELELSPNPQRFFLEQARVGLSDGKAFGDEGAGFVRLNFATSAALLSEILQRMDSALAAR